MFLTFISFLAFLETVNNCNYELQGGQMGSNMLGHTESTDFVRTENLGHLFVGKKILLVVGGLEVVFLEVSPKFLDAFGTAGLILANNSSQIGAELQRFGESGSLRHFDKFFDIYFWKNLK